MKLFIGLAMLIVPCCVLAQKQFTIQGRVIDLTGTSLQNMTVSLYYEGATDTLRQLTNDKGSFNFKNIPASTFFLKVSGSGYEPYSKKISSLPGENNQVVLENITLANVAKLLPEVIVKSNTTIEIKEDTISYKADSFKTRPNDMAEDLLKKLPGVEVDREGNVTAHGKSITKVKVNGKDFFGTDIKAATREIPVELIDKVQVIDDYGDQAAFTGVKDAEPEKIINLQLKSDKVKGYSGNVSAGVGTEERYKVSGTLLYFNDDLQVSLLGNINNVNSSLFNFSAPGLGSGGRSGSGGGRSGSGGGGSGGGIVAGAQGLTQSGIGGTNGITDTKSGGFNYRDSWGKKITAYGNYVYTYKKTLTITNTTQQNFFSDNTNTITQNTLENSDGSNQRGNFNIEYKIDSNNYIKFNPQFSYRSTNTASLTTFNTITSDLGTTNEGNIDYTSDVRSPNISGSLLLNHKFAKRGRTLSVNITSGTFPTDQEDNDNNFTTYFFTDGSSVDSTQFQNTIQDNTNYNYGVKASYTEPVSIKNNIEFNYSFNRQFTGNDKQTFFVDPNSGAKTFDDTLSNIYENDYITNRFGLNFRTTEKKYNYTLGVAVQPATFKSNSFTSSKLSFTQHLLNWFPVARLAYNFSRTRSFDASYNGRTTQPSYSQLQPVADVSNPQFITVGNPELDPEFSNTLNIRYNNFDFMKGDVFLGNLSFTFTKDKIVTNTIDKGQGIQETRYLNSDGYYSANGFYVFSKPFQNRKYIVSLNGRVTYTKNISYLDSLKNTGKNWVLTQAAKLELNLADWLDFSANASYSLNSNRYTLEGLQNSTTNTYLFGGTARIFLPAGFVISYDIEKTINTGYSGGEDANPFLINGYIEKQFFKKKNGTIRLEAFDLLDQNTSVSRTVTASSITDTFNNRLGNYYMLTFSLRLSKFKGGKEPQPQRGIPERLRGDNM